MFILYFMKSIDAPPPFDEPAWPARRFVRPWPVPSPEVGLVQPDTVHIDTQILDGDGRRWAENPQAISRSSGVFCWSHAAFQTKRVTRTANKLFRVLMKLRSTRECKINHELMQTKFLCLVCPDIPNTKDTVFKSLARNFAASFCSVLCSAAAVCHLRSMMQNTASHEPQHPVNGTEPACHAIKGSCSFLACPSATLAHLKLAASLGVSPNRLQHVANECLSWLPGFPSQTPRSSCSDRLGAQRVDLEGSVGHRRPVPVERWGRTTVVATSCHVPTQGALHIWSSSHTVHGTWAESIGNSFQNPDSFGLVTSDK